MATMRWIYDGDGLIHSPVQPKDRAHEATVEQDPGARRKLAERRAEALRRFFPKLASWMKDRVQLGRMSAVERYLAQATDLHDLELRIREIERKGLWH